MPNERTNRATSARVAGPGLALAGGLLFLFIPLVLFLFVAHPAPVGASLAAGVALMLGHRFLARPYMRRALAGKCLWCNRALALDGGGDAETLAIRSGGTDWRARFCPGHRAPAARFLAFVEGWAWALRLGIFLPLLVLLAALAATALGRSVPLATATDLFRLLIGVAVNVAAWGYLLRPAAAAERAPVRLPFPLHNFTLLGIRTLLWIFRLVGIWWIALALAHRLGR